MRRGPAKSIYLHRLHAYDQRSQAGFHEYHKVQRLVYVPYSSFSDSLTMYKRENLISRLF